MHSAPTKTVLISTEQLIQIVPVCSRTIKRWVDRGLFPKPIRQGQKNFWPADKIDAWVEAGGVTEH